MGIIHSFYDLDHSYHVDISTDPMVCSKCEEDINDPETAIFKGCPICGNTRFKFKSKESSPKPISKLLNMKDSSKEISLQIHGRGVFSFNIENLIQNSMHDNPIMIQDPNGIINILYKSEK